MTVKELEKKIKIAEAKLAKASILVLRAKTEKTWYARAQKEIEISNNLHDLREQLKAIQNN